MLQNCDVIWDEFPDPFPEVDLSSSSSSKASIWEFREFRLVKADPAYSSEMAESTSKPSFTEPPCKKMNTKLEK